MRIAVAGFQHETNTFAPQPATLADFEAPDAWPGLVRGADMIDAVKGINLPAAGFIDTALASGHDLVPLTWCSATPSGRVTHSAYEHISSLILDGLRASRGIEAVYLDLHGAMVAEHIDDGDGELLHRIRALVGRDVRIVASLDYHANVSAQMVSNADCLIAYRSYPHVDMSDTGVRALRCLSELRTRRFIARRHPMPFLIPLTSQCTLVEPMAGVIAEVERHDVAPIHCLNFTPGFPAADVAECGPVVFGFATDEPTLAAAVDHIVQVASDREAQFALEIHSIQAALHEIARSPSERGRPIILADTQDNPGGGGTADTTSLLKALHAARVHRVLAGVMCDSQAALRAHQAGVGAQVELALGGRSGFDEPFTGRFSVEALGDGRFEATGPFYLGSRMDLGPMALLRIGELHIAVASRKQQAADQAMFRHLKVEPSDFAVLALKSSVHFRADFGPIARRILVVDAPGANIADPRRLPFTKMQRRVASANANANPGANSTVD
jgi:microcystin degradation protein MlrC